MFYVKPFLTALHLILYRNMKCLIDKSRLLIFILYVTQKKQAANDMFKGIVDPMLGWL